MIGLVEQAARLGAAIRYMTLKPPADSPAMVTLRRIAAEGRDVALDPAQRRDLVEQAVIARDAFAAIPRSTPGCAR